MTARPDDVADGVGPVPWHLFGPYWGRVDSVPDPARRLWTWAVVRDDVPDGADPVAEGFAYDLEDAEHAVDEWVRDHRPRSLWHRVGTALRRT